MTGIFSAAFAALEPFADWALPSERQRHEKKSGSTMAEVQAFYDAFLPLLPDALDYLNGFELSDLPAAERRLLDLCLAMVEAGMAVEMFGEVSPAYLMAGSRFVPVHDDW
jgi:hypothetical protein